MSTTLAETPLHAWHRAHGGRMVDFGGWSMPVQYTSIVDEHDATRNAAGLFDISHMGRLRFEGADAAAFVDSLVTRRTDDMPPGRARYAMVTNETGGILDDILVYHLIDADGTSYRMLVVNAGNREKIVGWFQQHRASFSGQVTMTDATLDWAMIALQGPLSEELLTPLTTADLGAMRYYTITETTIAGHEGKVSRTGYTGEIGFEIILPAEAATGLWEQLLDAGSERGVVPCGLGSRDTLRFEAGMPLYGHELSETINPFQAGLEFGVDLDKRDYPGRAALIAAHERKDLPVRVGLELDSQRIAREGAAIVAGEQSVGTVTSGTFSPTLQKTIAMGYVMPDRSNTGESLEVDIRGRRVPAHVVSLPFYRRQTERKPAS